MRTEQQLAESVAHAMLERDAFSRWLGIELLAIAPRRCTVRMTVREEMVNGFGVSHGGIAYALAEESAATNRLAFYGVTVRNQSNAIVALFRGTVYRTNQHHVSQPDAHD